METAIEKLTTETVTEAPKPARKWTSTAGPLQTKRVNQALRAISAEGQTYTEKTGVIGVSENEWSYQILFGAQREDCTAAMTAVAEKFDYTVTRENFQAIIAECAAQLPVLVASRPVTDKRVTAEAQAETDGKHRQAEQEREAKDRQHRADVSAKVIQIQPKYSFAVAPREGLSEHARAAQNIRHELGAAFPGIRFEVKSEYDRVSVRWDFGPTSKLVEEITGKYQNKHWEHDGGDGREVYDHSVGGEAIGIVLGRIGYVSMSRSFANETHEQVARLLCELQHVQFENMYQRNLLGDGETYDLRDHVHQVLNVTSFPYGATITRAESTDDGRCQFHDEMFQKYGEGWAMQSNRDNLFAEDRARLEAFEARDNETEHRHWCRLVLDVPAAVPVTQTPMASSASGITVKRNTEHDGVEIRFPAKPEPDTLSRLKSHGWRWSMRSKCWYKRFSESAWHFAHEVAGIMAPEAKADPGPDRFDMAVEDRMAEACGL